MSDLERESWRQIPGLFGAFLGTNGAPRRPDLAVRRMRRMHRMGTR